MNGVSELEENKRRIMMRKIPSISCMYKARVLHDMDKFIKNYVLAGGIKFIMPNIIDAVILYFTVINWEQMSFLWRAAAFFAAVFAMIAADAVYVRLILHNDIIDEDNKPNLFFLSTITFAGLIIIIPTMRSWDKYSWLGMKGLSAFFVLIIVVAAAETLKATAEIIKEFRQFRRSIEEEARKREEKYLSEYFKF